MPNIFTGKSKEEILGYLSNEALDVDFLINALQNATNEKDFETFSAILDASVIFSQGKKPTLTSFLLNPYYYYRNNRPELRKYDIFSPLMRAVQNNDIRMASKIFEIAEQEDQYNPEINLKKSILHEFNHLSPRRANTFYYAIESASANNNMPLFRLFMDQVMGEINTKSTQAEKYRELLILTDRNNVKIPPYKAVTVDRKNPINKEIFHELADLELSVTPAEKILALVEDILITATSFNDVAMFNKAFEYVRTEETRSPGTMRRFLLQEDLRCYLLYLAICNGCEEIAQTLLDELYKFEVIRPGLIAGVISNQSFNMIWDASWRHKSGNKALNIVLEIISNDQELTNEFARAIRPHYLNSSNDHYGYKSQDILSLVFYEIIFPIDHYMDNYRLERLPQQKKEFLNGLKNKLEPVYIATLALLKKHFTPDVMSKRRTEILDSALFAFDRPFQFVKDDATREKLREDILQDIVKLATNQTSHVNLLAEIRERHKDIEIPDNFFESLIRKLRNCNEKNMKNREARIFLNDILQNLNKIRDTLNMDTAFFAKEMRIDPESKAGQDEKAGKKTIKDIRAINPFLLIMDQVEYKYSASSDKEINNKLNDLLAQMNVTRSRVVKDESSSKQRATNLSDSMKAMDVSTAGARAAKEKSASPGTSSHKATAAKPFSIKSNPHELDFPSSG